MKRSTLINDIEGGDIKMLDLKSMISSPRTMCVEKDVEHYESLCKYFSIII